VLAEMYARFILGEGFQRITRWLNQSSITTAAGNEWSRNVVKATLDAGFGAGMIVHRPGGVRRRTNMIFTPGAHEPV
ncbi:recombinase family protein, partial [Rhizobium johnstonii]|uniref:recombinase family protein n=1 Tax=Rhizobium johnstonii TaxID=3019933 RepID=UPI003F9460AA